MDALLDKIQETAIAPAMALLPQQMNSNLARLHMFAITLQEALGVHRVQVLDGGRRGPAHGLWQFERGGGVRGVLQHAATSHHALRVCAALGVRPTAEAVWLQLEHDDVLAAAFARLLLYTDPRPLPLATDPNGAWRLYCDRLWRPGKPHENTWLANWLRARKAVGL